jgi:hypothetical protein
LSCHTTSDLLYIHFAAMPLAIDIPSSTHHLTGDGINEKNRVW